MTTPYWLELPRPDLPCLDRDLTADVVVIGAGISGLKVARCLDRYGLRTVVLEASRAGQGASSRNQGGIHQDPSMGYLECSKSHGRKAACALWQMGVENHRLLHAQIQEHQIACDYEVNGSVKLLRRDTPDWQLQLDACRQEVDALRADGFDVVALNEQEAIELGNNPIYVGGMRYLTNAQFHSGKFVVSLARAVADLPNVEVYEQARVHQIEPQGSGLKVTCATGAISCRSACIGTNAVAPQIFPELADALRAERGQIFVTALLSERPCKGAFGTEMAWWREIIEPQGRFRLLFGGGRQREEPDSLFRQFTASGASHPKLESEGFSPSAEHQQRLEQQFAILFPQYTSIPITHRWGGLQSFTADGMPEIGLFGDTGRVFGMAGLCGRGNTHTDVGAEYLAGRMAGVESNIERRFGWLFTTLMQVGRQSAVWGPWRSAFDES